jgi:PAS domain-containing protein
MAYRSWLTDLDGWVCPPPAPDRAGDPGEGQRLLTSRFLVPMTLICGTFLLALDPSRPAFDLGWTLIGLSILLGVCVAGMLFCHWRQHILAAFVAILAMEALGLWESLPNLRADAYGGLFIFPVCVAGVLLGAPYCFPVALFQIAIADAIPRLIYRLPMGYSILELAHDSAFLAIAGFVALSATILHRMLRIAARSGQLEELNARLRESVAGNAHYLSEITALNQQLQAALADSEHTRTELAAVFDLVDDAIGVFTPDLYEIHLNRATQQLLGQPAQPGRSLAEGARAIMITALDGTPIPPNEIPVVHAALTHEAAPPTLSIFHREGRSPVIGLARAMPLRTAQDEEIGILFTVRDVTSGHLSARNANVLRAVAHACAMGADMQSVALRALQALMQGLQLHAGFIALADPQRPGFVRTVAAEFATSYAFLAQTEILQRLEQTPIGPNASMLLLRVMATGKALLGFVRPPERPGQAAIAVGSIPLIIDGRVVGGLSVAYHPQPNAPWDHSLDEVLLTSAEEIATSLHRARLL